MHRSPFKDTNALRPHLRITFPLSFVPLASRGSLLSATIVSISSSSRVPESRLDGGSRNLSSTTLRIVPYNDLSHYNSIFIYEIVTTLRWWTNKFLHVIKSNDFSTGQIDPMPELRADQRGKYVGRRGASFEAGGGTSRGGNNIFPGGSVAMMATSNNTHPNHWIFPTNRNNYAYNNDAMLKKNSRLSTHENPFIPPIFA